MTEGDQGRDDAREPTRKTLTGPTASGAGLTVMEVVAAALPVVGGPLAVALNEMKTSREHRLVDFVLDLDADLRALGDRLDSEFVVSAEFARRAETVFERVVQARQVAKREFYRRALVDGATRERPDADEWQILTDALDRVELPHLRLLAGLAVAPPAPKSGNVRVHWDHMKAATPDMTDLARARCWDDLGNLGILSSRNIVSDNVPPDLDDDDALLTPFGRRFVGFLGMELAAGQPVNAARERRARAAPIGSE